MGQEAVVFTRTYDETLQMMVEARNYLAHLRKLRGKNSDLGDLRVSCEALRVTSRLTQALAWLLLQRAVQEGELSREEACREGNRLGGQEVCLDNAAESDPSLPPGLRSLLQRSSSLYQRVSRLEAMVLTSIH